MTSEEFKHWRHFLCMSVGQLAWVTQWDERAIRRFEKGERAIPYPMRRLIDIAVITVQNKSLAPMRPTLGLWMNFTSNQLPPYASSISRIHGPLMLGADGFWIPQIENTRLYATNEEVGIAVDEGAVKVLNAMPDGRPILVDFVKRGPQQ